MLADGVPQLVWSAWATPFGLTARTAPFADNRVAPLLVLVTFPIVQVLLLFQFVQYRPVA
jgi:ABC-2 type transport system permease protein